MRHFAASLIILSMALIAALLTDPVAAAVESVAAARGERVGHSATCSCACGYHDTLLMHHSAQRN